MSPLFSVENNHPKLCGEPPTVDWKHARYSSYFENEHNEQWLCWEDRMGVVHIAGGDQGWNNVTSIRPDDIRQEVKLPLKLSNAERLWVSACLSAIRGRLVFVVQG
jgi:hypothetical protein